MRIEQREATRHKIVKAALTAFSVSGFEGMSTRTIAEQAEVSQGLLTYHFKTKESLWQAAADHLFTLLDQRMSKISPTLDRDSPQSVARETIRQLVYFNAEHPELIRFMMEQGKGNSKRTRWLVDTHLKPRYKQFQKWIVGYSQEEIPHVFYVVAGASGTIFSVPDECKQLTGINPRTKITIQRHADFVAELLVPVQSQRTG